MRKKLNEEAGRVENINKILEIEQSSVFTQHEDGDQVKLCFINSFMSLLNLHSDMINCIESLLILL